RLAAVYLAGYVAEMILKAAYFRLRGWSPTAPIRMADLRNAVNHAVTVRGVTFAPPGRRCPDLHHLPGWRDLLIAERSHHGPAYLPRFRRALVARVSALALNWSPELRYHSNRPHRAEVRVSLEAADWLRSQSVFL